MIALWIVLAVVVVLLAAALVVGVRRRAARAGSVPPSPVAAPPAPPPKAQAAPAGPTLAPVPPPEAVALEAAVPETAAPEAAPPRFRDRMGKARSLFGGMAAAVRARAHVDGATWDELEEALIRADVGVATTDALLSDLRQRVARKEVVGGTQLIDALRQDLVALLAGGAVGAPDGNGASPGAAMDRSLRFDPAPGAPNVWLFVGVNGVGKTTTVGKLARQQAALGRSVLLAAGDTFRAAAGDQLALWADRAGVEVVRGGEGGDPSAVVFDAVQRAAARGNELVLADTAGRLHTKVNLVEELKKIRRVADREPGRVTEVLLVLDATTGQNGLTQARQFTDAVSLTGVVLTKLDGTAKGGVVVAVQRELGVPVKLVGLGEGPDDLVAFDPAEFVDALLSS